MALVPIAPRHVGWSDDDGELVASVRIERVDGEIVLRTIEYEDERHARELLEAVAYVATSASRMVGDHELLGTCGFEHDGSRWVRDVPVAPAGEEETHAITLGALEEAIRASWSRETSDSPDEWTDDNPALGQCGVTARVVRDYLGGEIVVAGAICDGQRIDRHVWNVFPSGFTIDLTRVQFPPGTRFEAPKPVEAFMGDPEHYELLAARVRAALAR